MRSLVWALLLGVVLHGSAVRHERETRGSRLVIRQARSIPNADGSTGTEEFNTTSGEVQNTSSSSSSSTLGSASAESSSTSDSSSSSSSTTSSSNGTNGTGTSTGTSATSATGPAANYSAAMHFVLETEQNLAALEQRATDAQQRMMKLESLVSGGDVNVSYENQAWSTINLRAQANARRVAHLGLEAQELGRKFQVIGARTSAMIGTASGNSSCANATNATNSSCTNATNSSNPAANVSASPVAAQVTRLEGLIAMGEWKVDHLANVSADIMNYTKVLENGAATVIKANLRPLADEVRKALENTTEQVLQQGERSPCSPC